MTDRRIDLTTLAELLRRGAADIDELTLGGPVIDAVDGHALLTDEMQIPGNGIIPPRADQLMRPLQPWARLCLGRPLGKKEVLAYDNTASGAQSSMTTILDVGGQDGSDLDALNVCVTLSQPRVIPIAFSGGGVTGQNQQNASGSYDNAGIGTGDFPGTGAPIAWVPITAVIEWGLGGTRQRAYVDFKQGQVVNLSASWVRVHAAVAPDAANLLVVDGPALTGNTSGLYELAAFVGPGWSRGRATRTVFLGTIDAVAESGVFAVPPFAQRATVIGLDPVAVGTNPPAVTAAYLRFWQDPTGVTDGFNVGNYYQAGNSPLPFDVPNGAAYFSVQNGNGVDLPYAVIFELAI